VGPARSGNGQARPRLAKGQKSEAYISIHLSLDSRVLHNGAWKNTPLNVSPATSAALVNVSV
jgi:hypothetical protein